MSKQLGLPRFYRCNHCRQVVERDSDKQWITSYCGAVGRKTRLWLVAADRSAA